MGARGQEPGRYRIHTFEGKGGHSAGYYAQKTGQGALRETRFHSQGERHPRFRNLSGESRGQERIRGPGQGRGYPQLCGSSASLGGGR